MNTNAFRSLSYGVYAVTAFDAANGRPTGCIANSVMQITSSPATLAISLNHQNYTNLCVKNNKLLAVSVFGENTDSSLIGRFGFKSGRDTEKFDGVNYLEKDGLPVLAEACSYFTLKVLSTLETATHTVFLAEVMDADVLNDDNAMTYAYYHKVIRGKTAPNAPTYIKEEASDNSAKKKYVCDICGYVYEGEIPFDKLPSDYKCPICGADKSHFKLK